MDSNGDRSIDKQEFYWGLKDLGCSLTKKDAAVLLDYLDLNQDGTISYDEFLSGLRGIPNAARQVVIDQAFAKFDSHNSGFASVADLGVVYDSSRHPKVISGQITNNDVFNEFLACFGDRRKDGTISKAEWNDYYGGVSASIISDAYFIDLVSSVWRL